MADPRRRKKSPTEELFRQVMGKIDGGDQRLASMEQQLVLMRNEIARHGRLIEEVNNRCIEKLGLQCAIDARDDDEDDGL